MSTTLRFDARNQRARVLVLGDVMLDRYTFGTVERVSPEAPVLVLRETSSEVRLGGAANVAAMCRALGAEVSVAGFIGDDHDGRTIRRLLTEQSIDDRCLVVDPERTTTVKQRFLGGADHRQAQPFQAWTFNSPWSRQSLMNLAHVT
jgi:rfaE bifunctional protein kinase chain/domain